MPLPSCCSEDVQQYRDFNVTWNITKVGETVVTDCKADGVIGKYKKQLVFCIYDKTLILQGM